MSFWNKLKIDTEKLSVSMDGKTVDHIKKISFDWTAGKHPAVRIELDSDVVLEGIMLRGAASEIVCPQCGKVLGELAGRYDVCCPDCGYNCYSF